MSIKQNKLFVSGTDEYHTYRIPALEVSNAGTILAFCEGRRHGGGDSGDIDILLKRSFDNGDSWGETQTVVHTGPDVDGNPAPVVDKQTGTIWLVFCKNLADGHEREIVAGNAPRTVWVTHSDDDGATWAEPRELTDDVKRPNWTWYATGPCHGIQLQNGRLVIPCDHVVGNSRDYAAFGHSHIIYSDDHGESWHIGGIAQAGTNESVAVQTSDGRLYLNCRNYLGEKRRAYAWSDDNGDTFSDFGYHENLVEPICQASMVCYTDDKNRVLFANPASTARERLTIRISDDECRSWNDGKVLHPGPAAYSDLCITADKQICCLYECGEARPYEMLTLARFDLEWLDAS
jgi:sialidase-1